MCCRFSHKCVNFVALCVALVEVSNEVQRIQWWYSVINAFIMESNMCGYGYPWANQKRVHSLSYPSSTNRLSSVYRILIFSHACGLQHLPFPFRLLPTYVSNIL